MKTLHKGLMADCKVCTPVQKPKRRDRYETKVVRKVRGLEGNLRRQMAEEIGDAELSKDCRFQVMQHYGIIASRIDRKITKPFWMEESRWKTLKQEFYNATKGMFPSPRHQTRSQSLAIEWLPHQNKKWSEIKHKKYHGPKPPPISPPQV